MNIGRNAPCPCGSGKKYKKCCLGKAGDKSLPLDIQGIMAEAREKLEQGEYSSLEEAQVELDRFMEQKNKAPLAQFHGLSPVQMHRFLHFPFDSLELARFSESIMPPPDVSALRLLSLLVEGIGDKGLKTTATGNLPQKFCQESALAFQGEERYKNRIQIFSIRTEPEFDEMHCLRLVAGLAGIVRKYKGKFILSQKVRKKIETHGLASLYYEVLQTYIQKFNWAYRDGYEELPFLQQSFLFSLYILQKYGGKTREHTFYEDIFVKAFPQLLEEVSEVSYRSAEETVRDCYTLRVLRHFASYFGLIECIPTSEDFLNRQYTVRKLPLLDQIVTFNV